MKERGKKSRHRKTTGSEVRVIWSVDWWERTPYFHKYRVHGTLIVSSPRSSLLLSADRAVKLKMPAAPNSFASETGPWSGDLWYAMIFGNF